MFVVCYRKFIRLYCVKRDTIPQEAPHEIEGYKPQPQCPEHGVVELSYVKTCERSNISLETNRQV